MKILILIVFLLSIFNVSYAQMPPSQNEKESTMLTIRAYEAVQLEQFEVAEKHLKKAVELYPTNDRAYSELGGVYVEIGNYKKAEESFLKAIELNPRNPLGHFGLGGLYAGMGRIDEAKKELEKVIEVGGQNATNIVNAAKQFLQKLSDPAFLKMLPKS